MKKYFIGLVVISSLVILSTACSTTNVNNNNGANLLVNTQPSITPAANSPEKEKTQTYELKLFSVSNPEEQLASCILTNPETVGDQGEKSMWKIDSCDSSAATIVGSPGGGFGSGFGVISFHEDGISSPASDEFFVVDLNTKNITYKGIGSAAAYNNNLIYLLEKDKNTNIDSVFSRATVYDPDLNKIVAELNPVKPGNTVTLEWVFTPDAFGGIGIYSVVKYYKCPESAALTFLTSCKSDYSDLYGVNIGYINNKSGYDVKFEKLNK